MTPDYGLRPVRIVRCARCPRVVELPCGCESWVDPADGPEPGGGHWAAATEFESRGAAALHSSSSCSPAIPERCPGCGAKNWLVPRLYVQGQGKSASARWRRAGTTLETPAKRSR